MEAREPERISEIWEEDIAPLAGCGPNNVPIYEHSTPDGVKAAEFVTRSSVGGIQVSSKGRAC